jgi:hypothetical protein
MMGWASRAPAALPTVWQTNSLASVTRETTPAEAVQLQAGRGGIAATRDWRALGELTEQATLSFQLQLVSAATATAPAIEVQFLEPDGRSRFWRKVVLTNSAAATLELPLRFFRSSGTRLPDWSHISHIGFYFRDPATVRLSALELRREAGRGPDFTCADVAAIAGFGAPVRRVSTPEYALLTDCAALDLAVLTNRLATLTGDLRKLLPAAPAPRRPPLLLVFATRAAYQQFPPRFAGLFNSAAAAPDTDGFTLLGVASSAWSPEKGTLRPVYLHEFTHAWLEQAAALACDGGWLQEGVANYFQLRNFPQANFAALVRQSLAQEATHVTPLRELLDGRRIPLNRYWQTVTVLDLLLNRPPYAGKFPALLAELLRRNSVDLAPALQPVYGVDFATFERDWRQHCAEKYPAP